MTTLEVRQAHQLGRPPGEGVARGRLSLRTPCPSSASSQHHPSPSNTLTHKTACCWKTMGKDGEASSSLMNALTSRNCPQVALFVSLSKAKYALGVLNSKKLSISELFSTDFGPKVIDQSRIFPAASIWSCTVASNLKNATSLCCSKFYTNKISF